MRLHSLAALLVAASCAGTSSIPTSPIAGTYQTAVTLTSSTCTGITVQNNPTTIAHTSGATTFTLTHAGQTYNGTLGMNDAFTTAAKPIAVGTTTHTLTISGSFTSGGFVADVTAVVTGSASCQYVVHWQGTR